MPWDEALLCLAEAQALEAEDGAGAVSHLLRRLVGAAES